MKIKDIFAKLTAKNIDLSGLSATDILDLDNDEPNAPIVTNPIDIDSINHNRRKIEDVLNENATLKAMVQESQNTIKQFQEATKKQIDDLMKGFAEKETASQTLINTYETERQAKLDNENQLKIESIINKAIEDRRIPKDNTDLQDKYKKLLTNDLETAEGIINGLPSLEIKNSMINVPTSPNSNGVSQAHTSVGSGINPKILEYVNKNVEIQ